MRVQSLVLCDTLACRILATMSSGEPRIGGAFGENGLISLKQIQPTILSFEKPLLSRSLESVLMVLGTQFNLELCREFSLTSLLFSFLFEKLGP